MCDYTIDGLARNRADHGEADCRCPLPAGRYSGDGSQTSRESQPAWQKRCQGKFSIVEKVLTRQKFPARPICPYDKTPTGSARFNRVQRLTASIAKDRHTRRRQPLLRPCVTDRWNPPARAAAPKPSPSGRPDRPQSRGTRLASCHTGRARAVEKQSRAPTGTVRVPRRHEPRSCPPPALHCRQAPP